VCQSRVDPVLMTAAQCDIWDCGDHCKETNLSAGGMDSQDDGTCGMDFGEGKFASGPTSTVMHHVMPKRSEPDSLSLEGRCESPPKWCIFSGAVVYLCN
jgi:hypothetical protein